MPVNEQGTMKASGGSSSCRLEGNSSKSKWGFGHLTSAQNCSRCLRFVNVLLYTHNLVVVFIISFLQIRRLKPREVRRFASGHRASSLRPRLPGSGAHAGSHWAILPLDCETGLKPAAQLRPW